MTFWLATLGLVGTAAVVMLWPLIRGGARDNALDRAIAFYEARKAELERQHSAGECSDEELAAALAEQGRSLLAISRNNPSRSAADSATMRRRKIAALSVLVGMPLVSLAVYVSLGAPSAPDQPLASRPRNVQNLDLATALQQIEAHLAKNPGDVRGFELVAPIYVKIGRFADAAEAYRRLIALTGETPALLADFGESLVAKADGMVDGEARGAFERAIKLDAEFAKAQFYLALAREQDGDVAGAFAELLKLQSNLPDGAPRMRVSAEIERMRAQGKGSDTGPAAAIAALPESERRDAIRAMVEGLDARLGDSGGTLEEWRRLVQARIVLGERDKASTALERARQALAADPAAAPVLEALATALRKDTR